jgi:hypothetical protein
MMAQGAAKSIEDGASPLAVIGRASAFRLARVAVVLVARDRKGIEKVSERGERIRLRAHGVGRRHERANDGETIV